ncbi:MAG TPA: hypothetical protein VG389_01905 [Myxococcota bacterium]|nr:hypothetical protein [Myxococcota bacterium]
MNRPFSFMIDLPVRNDWANVDLLRTSILNCFTATFHDMDGCHSLAMVAGELLENAIKYGDWKDGERALRLRVWGDAAWAKVQVDSPVQPDSPSLGALNDAITWLDAYPSAEDAYRARLLAVAARPLAEGGGKLGIARIAYEGNCKLKAEVKGDLLSVTSHMTF